MSCIRQERCYESQTKITERPDTNDFLYPIILPSKHPLTEKIIRYFHKDGGHLEVQERLNRLPEKFLILKGRKTVKSVINKCVICKKQNARRYTAEAVYLPLDRVRDAAVFEIVGVNLTGPFYLKSTEKVWITIFTCAVYRAVHLELIPDMSTECFMLCLRKFISRRGRPKIIYSDNGRNFVGTENLLNNINWTDLEKETVCYRIKWKFIPPAAPWWEKIIQILKQMLAKCLRKAKLTYDELQTIICDCEAAINSRPLTYLSEDVNDIVPLTPSLFLQDVKEIGTVDLDYV